MPFSATIVVFLRLRPIRYTGPAAKVTLLVNHDEVLFEFVATGEGPGAQAALVRPLAGVRANVDHEVPLPDERLGAKLAVVGSLARVGEHVPLEVGPRDTGHRAEVALEAPLNLLRGQHLVHHPVVFWECAAAYGSCTAIGRSALARQDLVRTFVVVGHVFLLGQHLVPCVINGNIAKVNSAFTH